MIFEQLARQNRLLLKLLFCKELSVMYHNLITYGKNLAWAKRVDLILIFFLILLFIQPASAWYDISWNYKVDSNISDGYRPYQISLNISNSTGTNNATHIYCNGHCNLRFK